MAEPIQYYEIMSAPCTVDHLGLWFHALGLITGFFAQLEWASFAVIDQIGTPQDQISAAHKNYVARTEFAANLVQTRLASQPSLAAEWAAFFLAATSVADMRNKILHNPMSVNFSQMQSPVGPNEGIVLMKELGRPTMLLGDVQAFAGKLGELNKTMLSLFARTTF